MKKILLLLCVLFMTGCSREADVQAAKNYLDDVIYLKDKRTGLCFAYIRPPSLYRGPAIAHCPCENIPEELFE